MPGGNNKAMNKTYIKFIGSLLIAVIFICTLSKAIPTIVLALDTSADNTVVSHKTMSLDVERLVASGADINNTFDNINSEDATDDADNDTEDGSSTGNKAKVSYKVYAIIITLALAGIVCATLAMLGKNNPKNFIFVFIATAAATVLILTVDIKRPDDYYSGTESMVSGDYITVTVSVRCDAILDGVDGDETLDDYIPEDGIILPETEISVPAGASAYDVLVSASRKYRLHIDTNSIGSVTYISGINYIYEGDYGDLSGWMFRVDGKIPSVGCGDYTVSDGEHIEWFYTLDFGAIFK
jgi:hypothetical protein